MGPKIPRRGAPGVGTVGAWVGQKAESPHCARAARQPRQVPQGAKTRVRVSADIQTFALRAHSCTAFPETDCGTIVLTYFYYLLLLPSLCL